MPTDHAAALGAPNNVHGPGCVCNQAGSAYIYDAALDPSRREQALKRVYSATGGNAGGPGAIAVVLDQQGALSAAEIAEHIRATGRLEPDPFSRLGLCVEAAELPLLPMGTV